MVNCFLNKRTALHYAAAKNHDSVLNLLLNKGAKLVPDANGIYFVTSALRKNNEKAAKAIANSSR